MKTYFAIVQKETDSAYGISFPDLPGCFSAADDEQDIYAQAQSALALYARGEDALPAARSISALHQDQEVQADLAEGAFLIGVPLIVAERKARYNVMLEPSLVKGIDKAAKAAGVSRSEFVSRAVGWCLETQAGAVLVTRDRVGRAGAAFATRDKAVRTAKKLVRSASTGVFEISPKPSRRKRKTSKQN